MAERRRRPALPALVPALLLACVRLFAAGAPFPVPTPAPGAPAAAPSVPAPSVPATPGALSPTAGSASAVSGTAKARPKKARSGAGFARTFDQTQPISLQGRAVRYNQADETLLAEGNVVLVSGDTEVHADRLWYDMKQGLLRADGRVVVADSSGNTLWADRLAMNQVSRTGEAQGILYAQTPWTATCGGADMLPGDVVVLHGCECTSCRQEHPMWRLWAKRLRVKAGDSLTAWGVWLYTGRVPVFYVPYFSRSLKDPRPPVEIRPGYSSQLGSYLDLGYNYYLGDGQYGTVRYDTMSNYGNGYGLGQHYKFWGGEGTVAGYFNAQKNDPGVDNYSFNWTHKQNLGSGLTLMGNLQVLSNPDFNEIFDMSQVDSYSQRSYVELQSVQKGYSWNIQASRSTAIQTLPTADAAVQVTQSVTTQELLPSFNYSRTPQLLIPNSLLYWNFQAVAQRSLVVPQVLDDVSGTALEVYDPQAQYFLDGVTLTPSISDTLPIRHGLALSGTEGINLGWVQAEPTQSGGPAPAGSLGLVVPPAGGVRGAPLASYDTSEDLQYRPRTGTTLDLGYQYDRQLDPQAGALWSGEGLNQLSVKIQDQVRKDLSLLANESYNLLPFGEDRDLERLSLLNLQSSWTPSGGRSATLSAGYHVPTGLFKTVDAAFNTADPGRLWQANFTVDWVNNAIVQVQPPQDPTAPVELWPVSPRVMPDQLFAGVRNSLVLGPKWKISFYEQLDLVNRRANQQAFTLDRDFDCIDLQLYARQNLSVVTPGWQYGFSVSLSAAPNVKFDTNQLNADLFNPAQYGY